MSSATDAGGGLRRVAQGRKCGAFAGVCVVLLLSGAFVGLAMMAKGDSFLDLVDEGPVQWKVKDVMTAGEGWPIQMWDYSWPIQTGDGELEFEFNDAADKWFTVYLHNVWEGDLTGMTVEATFMISSTSAYLPVFIARAPDTQVQLRLNFQTTGGAYEPEDLWWSAEEYVVLTTYASGVGTTAPGVINTWLTLKVPLTPDQWLDHDGILGSDIQKKFKDAIKDIHEIGFSFGRSGSLASGVALTSGDATFILESFKFIPLVSDA